MMMLVAVVISLPDGQRADVVRHHAVRHVHPVDVLVPNLFTPSK